MCTTPKGSVRIAAWLLLSAIAAFSLISPDYRVTTFVPHDIEHFVIFALVACGLALRATRLLLRGDIAALNADFHPKSAKEELKEELDDLAVRQAPQPGGGNQP